MNQDRHHCRLRPTFTLAEHEPATQRITIDGKEILKAVSLKHWGKLELGQVNSDVSLWAKVAGLRVKPGGLAQFELRKPGHLPVRRGAGNQR